MEQKIIEMTANVVAAYVANNTVQPSDVRGLIEGVSKALTNLTNGTPAVATVTELKPAVPIKASVKPDYIVCLEDGKKFKTLRRHLASKYGMTPEEYRAKWDLPTSYPMVAPNYAEKRSELAKKFKLGQARRKVNKIAA